MFLLNKAKDGVDTVTGKKKLEAEKKSHEEAAKALEDTKEQLEESEAENAKLKETVEHLELELSNERAMRIDLQHSLQAKIDAEESAKEAEEREAAEKAAAEASLQQAEESAKQQALLDGQKAYDAMSGLITNDTKLSEAICLQSYAQNQVLRQVYVSNFGKDLYKRVKSNTGGHHRSLLMAVLDGPLVYICETLKEAMSGLGVNSQQLIGILCASNNDEVIAIKNKFQELYGKDLTERVSKATGGDLCKILVALLQATRSSDEQVDQAQLSADANLLFSAGQGKTIGSDLQPFISVLTQRSPAHLKALNEEYKKANKKGYDLMTAIQKVFGGDAQSAFLTIMSYNLDNTVHFYNVAENAMKGIGCDSVTLIDVLVRRREIDLDKIKVIYGQSGHKRPLYERVKDELGGDVGKAAVMLMGDYQA